MESATGGLYNPSYIRKLDKSQIPTCPIMGVEVAAINMDWLLNFTVQNIKALSGDYMCVSNVHTTVTAYEDEQYRRVQNGGIMAIPDGGPLSSVGQKRGYKTMSRTGACSIAVGIVTLVTGITAGVLMIVSGSRLLKRKSDILI